MNINTINEGNKFKIIKNTIIINLTKIQDKKNFYYLKE